MFFRGALMNSDWRWVACVLAFLSIPALGGWQYAKHLRIMNQNSELTISELPSHVKEELNQVTLTGLVVDDEDFTVRRGSREYAFVKSIDDSTGTESFALLKRKIDPETSLMDQISTGSVTGLVSGQKFRKDRALQFGFDVPDSAPNGLLIVDVDREYLGAIAGLTLGFSLLGLLGLVYVHAKLSDGAFKQSKAKDYLKSQVALQVAISKQEGYRTHY